jgi:hypothetical protein
VCWAGDVTPAFCQATVVQAAKAAGKYVVGYHYDAQSPGSRRLAHRLSLGLAGTLREQDGTVLVPAGQTMTYDQMNNIRCLVRGVVGNLPKS